MTRVLFVSACAGLVGEQDIFETKQRLIVGQRAVLADNADDGGSTRLSNTKALCRLRLECRK